MHADPTAEIEDLLHRLAVDRGRDALARAELLDELAGWWDRSGGLVEPVLERWIGAVVAAQATHGWRLADLQRAVAANAPAPQADLLASLERGVGPWRIRSRLPAAAAIANLVALRSLIGRLGAIPFVTDPADAPGADPGVLAKVRALLAKAESTTFEAESDALVAKAHQLMVRHAIDDTVLAGRPDRGEVTARRVFIDEPYLRAKFALLSEVAGASGGRALLSTGFGFATVFGYGADLEAIDLLYTSLLLQATAGATVARPATARRLAPAQVAAYRRAWLTAFAQRIGERLAAASAAVVVDASADHGSDLLPVVAARDAAVEAAVRAAAPNVRNLRTSLSSGEGWHDGRAAGDRATLATQAPLPRRPGALGAG